MNRDVLLKIYNAAVARALPAETLLPRLKNIRPAGRLLVFAAGKAAGSMAKAVEDYYAAQNMLARIEGIAVARPGYTLPLARLEMVEAAHPVPDEESPQPNARLRSPPPQPKTTSRSS